MKVLPKGHRRTYDCTKIEYCPEDTDKDTLLRLSRIAEHQGPLCRPQEGCSDAEDGPRTDNEATRVRMDVDSPNKLA